MVNNLSRLLKFFNIHVYIEHTQRQRILYEINWHFFSIGSFEAWHNRVNGKRERKMASFVLVFIFTSLHCVSSSGKTENADSWSFDRSFVSCLMLVYPFRKFGCVCVRLCVCMRFKWTMMLKLSTCVTHDRYMHCDCNIYTIQST